MNKFELQINRAKRAIWYVIAMVFRTFIPIKKGRVIMWSYYNKQYSCNPMYITEYILEHCSKQFDIVWAFNPNVNVSKLDSRIRIVYTHTLKYLYYLYSAQFVITNSRNDRYGDFFYKKNGQKYIMTWHGSTPLKKIEGDAQSELGKSYVRAAKVDSKMCDLMISNSKWFTNLIHKSFWYDGAILENGVPRNDIFFDKDKINRINKRIRDKYNIDDSAKIILYAPTFRSDNNPLHFKLNWDRILPEFEKKFNTKVVLFLRLHPNSLDNVDLTELTSRTDVINMCFYPDMQELLCIMDILITDYSSTMFESMILNKICFLYADDIETYDRHFYFELDKLPFSLSKNEDELVSNIKKFSSSNYFQNVSLFSKNYMCFYDEGHATESVVKWMLSQ